MEEECLDDMSIPSGSDSERRRTNRRHMAIEEVNVSWQCCETSISQVATRKRVGRNDRPRHYIQIYVQIMKECPVPS